MRYRKLSADDDYVFGQGQASFYRDNPDSVAQSVKTRLMLETGTWFLDVTEGMDWRTKVLGKYTADLRDVTIRSRILGTTGVTAIDAYSSALDRDSRRFSVNATIDTTYGAAKITESL
ncbi:MAG: hypothetical protein PW791_09225 [Neorhizobium sp.]|nr:hypothetical protein [Neorhizobium sp.]